MAEIGARLIDGADTVKPGDRGSAETGQLRKDEPHPMASLAARAQFGKDGFENRRLCRHEALQIEIGRCHLKLSSFTPSLCGILFGVVVTPDGSKVYVANASCANLKMKGRRNF